MIGFLCMAATTVYFYMQSILKPQTAKFQYVSMSVTGIATLAYLCMRANIGVSEVECAAGGCGGNPAYKTYPLFWMRYIDWFFTTPFFLLDLCLLADVDVWNTFFVMLMNALCITAGAIGALKPSVNIPMFIIGMLTFAAFIQKLFSFGEGNSHYKTTMKITMLLWAAYPVMYILCELTKTFTSEAEVWAYMILDVAAKCGCGILLVSGHESAKAQTYGTMA
jgi:bacteriorhodopsin